MEIDRIHFYVADANKMRDWSIEQMGLQALGDLSNCHTTTYLVGNAHLVIMISSPIDLTSPVADYLNHHPPGVKDIAFRVRDLDKIRQKIDHLGVKILAILVETAGINRSTIDIAIDTQPWVKIQGWGTLEHTIIQAGSDDAPDERLRQRNDWRSQIATTPDEPIIGIDHLVLNVAAGELDAATAWYENLFDFKVQQTFKIQTDRSGLSSKALTSQQGKIKFNINQPTSPNSQIQEFLDANRGAGIQHIAFETSNILQTVDRMQRQGLAFLPVPKSYYDELKLRARCSGMTSFTNDEWQTLERLQILVDWQPERPQALLLQAFTQPIFNEPTFFFEAIERRNGAPGFGQGNFQALFEAVEQNSERFRDEDRGT
jgi:4-hydroxyphenylpyruvate dioxygenase